MPSFKHRDVTPIIQAIRMRWFKVLLLSNYHYFLTDKTFHDLVN